MEHIKVKDLNDKSDQIQITEHPDHCPICHTSMFPKRRYDSIVKVKNRTKIVQLIYQCTNKKCQRLFIANYKQDHKSSTYSISYVSPKTTQEQEFSETIAEISPDFVEIFNQSIAAEAKKLTQIVGIGLRKALEFLIKDYIIKKNPDKEDKIRKLFLGKCIDKYVDDQNVKECAKRAVWLGNDETHYNRIWKDKDIEDLKLLTRLTSNWVENVELTEKYINEMQN
jgi:hypothetical protein